MPLCSITEDSDAVVIIVSEETGSISYCHEGVLYRDVGLDKLNAFLESTLVELEKKPEGTVSQWLGRFKASLQELPGRINTKLEEE